MNTTVRPSFQPQVSAEKLRRLELSREESAGLELREIRCPYCGFLIDKVFSDASGHKMVTCRKCKERYAINLGYFRRIKGWRKQDGFHSRRQRR